MNSSIELRSIDRCLSENRQTAQVNEVSMAIMCNLSHDVCCDQVMLEHTGALDSILQQVNAHTLVDYNSFVSPRVTKRWRLLLACTLSTVVHRMNVNVCRGV